MANAILEIPERTYRLSEKDRQDILRSNPFPSVWEVIETQLAAHRARHPDPADPHHLSNIMEVSS